jgi:hypothetical protein
MNFYHQYQCPDWVLDEVLREIKNINFSQNEHNLISNQEYKNKNLFNFFYKCLSDVRNKEFSESIDIYITSCWVNKSAKGQKHHKHMHVNSMLSGIFYLNSINSGNTVFYISNPWLYYEKTKVFKISKNSLVDHQYEIKPDRGKLIIFPSQIEHFVKENESETERYTIAFNTFFSGTIGENSTTHLRLDKIKNINFL